MLLTSRLELGSNDIANRLVQFTDLLAQFIWAPRIFRKALIQRLNTQYGRLQLRNLSRLQNIRDSKNCAAELTDKLSEAFGADVWNRSAQSTYFEVIGVRPENAIAFCRTDPATAS